MKKYLLLINGFLLSIFVNAQSLQLMKADGSSIVNDTILVTTNDLSSTIEVPVYVKNVSANSIDVFVKLYIKQSVTGSTTTYCWNSCFSTATTVSTAALAVEPGDTIKDFHSALEPNGNTGITEIMYTFFVNKNDNDSVSVTINYELVVTGIEENTLAIKNVRQYPNPANDFINFNYEINNNVKANIFIYDLVGKMVKNQSIDNTSGFTRIQISDLQNGMYIWSVEADGVPLKTDKFIKK